MPIVSPALWMFVSKGTPKCRFEHAADEPSDSDHTRLAAIAVPPMNFGDAITATLGGLLFSSVAKPPKLAPPSLS
jgi:hypothetical protein